MIEQILQLLKNASISHYLLMEKETHTDELFFIKKDLELQRGTDTVKYDLTLYRDIPAAAGRTLRGAGSCTLSAAMTPEQMQAAIETTYAAAEYAGNPFYPLVTPEAAPAGLSEHLSLPNLQTCVDALFQPDTDPATFINSAELFLTYTTCHLLNSEGVDVTFTRASCSGELIAQSVLEEDIELYQGFRFTDKDRDIPGQLSSLTAELLSQAKQRSKAKKLPADVPIQHILLRGDCLKEFFAYFIQNCDAAMRYPGFSNWNLHQKFDIPLTSLTLTVVPGADYTKEGIAQKVLTLIENNEITNLTGDCRFAYYMGIMATGTYEDFRVDCGQESLNPPPCTLEILHFSDFQMDTLTGQFGGEYRLACYYDSNGVSIPVTSGSISANMTEVLKTMRLSPTSMMRNGYEGPDGILF